MANPLYRSTFLRSHVDWALRLDADTRSSEWEGPDALRSLKEQRADSSPVSLREFFYGSPRIDPLYRAVPLTVVEPVKASADEILRGASDPRLQRPSGVWLQGPSGSGKTVALWRAFYDCVYAESPTPIRGFVPWWLKVPVDALENTGWESFLARALYPPMRVDRSLIRDWLFRSPPILLLCDLDAVLDEQRVDVANRLNHFLVDWDLRSAGHRCVIAYSGGQARHSLPRNLFSRIELGEWDDTPAQDYIRNFRVARGDRVVDPQSTVLVPANCRRPLEVHAIAEAPADRDLHNRYEVAKSISDRLIEHVRSSHEDDLVRVRMYFKLRDDEDVCDLIRTGSTRLALRMFYDEDDPVKSLPESHARELLRGLATSVPGEAFKGLPVHPLEPRGFWMGKNCRYFFNHARWNPVEFDRLVMNYSPFLKQRGGPVSFRNDFLRAYLVVAMSVRYYESPGWPPTHLPEVWYGAVCERLRVCPDRLLDQEQRPGFANLLGGVLEPQEVSGLLKAWIRNLDADSRRPTLAPLMLDLIKGLSFSPLCWRLYPRLSQELWQRWESWDPKNWPMEGQTLGQLHDAFLKEPEDVFMEFRDLAAPNLPMEKGRSR